MFDTPSQHVFDVDERLSVARSKMLLSLDRPAEWEVTMAQVLFGLDDGSADRVLAVRGRPGAATPPAPLRLTRRGRVVLVLAPLTALAALLLVAAAGTVPVEARSTAPDLVRVVTVLPGDTLWSIAERTAPRRDPREVVALLEAANRLPNAVVVPGQRLVLSGVR